MRVLAVETTALQRDVHSEGNAHSVQSLASWTAVVLYSFSKETDHDCGIPRRPRYKGTHSEGMPAISQGLREERAPPLVTERNGNDPGQGSQIPGREVINQGRTGNPGIPRGWPHRKVPPRQVTRPFTLETRKNLVRFLASASIYVWYEHER